MAPRSVASRRRCPLPAIEPATVVAERARQVLGQRARHEVRTRTAFRDRAGAIAHHGHQNIAGHEAVARILSGRTLFQVALSGRRGREHSPHLGPCGIRVQVAGLQVDNCAQLSTGFNWTVPPDGARETARMLRLSQMNSSLNFSPLKLSAPLLLKCPRVSLLA